jgi:hypothetical protein
LILVGDADGLRLAHVVEFFGLLGDGDLAGLPLEREYSSNSLWLFVAI